MERANERGILRTFCVGVCYCKPRVASVQDGTAEVEEMEMGLCMFSFAWHLIVHCFSLLLCGLLKYHRILVVHALLGGCND